MTADRGDFGGRLRAEREALGISLKQIAASTKISMLALEALERQDISRLPGGIFSRAFVRAYAKEVGLDPEQTVREFVERFPDDDDPVLSEDAIRARASRHDQDSAPSRAGFRWLGLGITIVLIVTFFGVQRYVMQQPVTGQVVEPKAPVVPPPAAPAPQGQAGADTAAEQVGQPTAIEPANAALRLVLSVDSACWVSAKADNKQVVRETLKAGARVEMAAADVIVLTVGNPAALTYTVNGAPGRQLGPANQVTTVVINKSNAQSFAR